MPRVDVPKPKTLDQRMLECAASLQDPTGRGVHFFNDVQAASELLIRAADELQRAWAPNQALTRALERALHHVDKIVRGAQVIEVCCCGECEL